jgi:hypothetical protein
VGWGLHAVTLCVDDMSNIDESNPHSLYGVGKYGLPTDSLGIEKFTLTGESGGAAQISFNLGSGSEINGHKVFHIKIKDLDSGNYLTRSQFESLSKKEAINRLHQVAFMVLKVAQYAKENDTLFPKGSRDSVLIHEDKGVSGTKTIKHKADGTGQEQKAQQVALALFEAMRGNIPNPDNEGGGRYVAEVNPVEEGGRTLSRPAQGKYHQKRLYQKLRKLETEYTGALGVLEASDARDPSADRLHRKLSEIRGVYNSMRNGLEREEDDGVLREYGEKASELIGALKEIKDTVQESSAISHRDVSALALGVLGVRPFEGGVEGNVSTERENLLARVEELGLQLGAIEGYPDAQRIRGVAQRIFDRVYPERALDGLSLRAIEALSDQASELIGRIGEVRDHSFPDFSPQVESPSTLSYSLSEASGRDYNFDDLSSIVSDISEEGGDLSGLSEQLDTLIGLLGELSGSGVDLEGNIGSLRDQLGGLTSQLDALAEKVGDLKGRAGDGVEVLNGHSSRLGGVEDEEGVVLGGLRTAVDGLLEDRLRVINALRDYVSGLERGDSPDLSALNEEQGRYLSARQGLDKKLGELTSRLSSLGEGVSVLGEGVTGRLGEVDDLLAVLGDVPGLKSFAGLQSKFQALRGGVEALNRRVEEQERRVGDEVGRVGELTRQIGELGGADVLDFRALEGVLDEALNELGRVPGEEVGAREAVAELIESVNALIQKMTAVKGEAGKQSARVVEAQQGLRALEGVLGRIARLDHRRELSGLETLIGSIEKKHLEFLRAVGEAQRGYTEGLLTRVAKFDQQLQGLREKGLLKQEALADRMTEVLKQVQGQLEGAHGDLEGKILLANTLLSEVGSIRSKIPGFPSGSELAVLQELLKRAQELSQQAQEKYDEMDKSLRSQLESLRSVGDELDEFGGRLGTLDTGIEELKEGVQSLPDAVAGVEREKERLEERSTALLGAIGERKKALGAMGTVFDQLNSRLSGVLDGGDEEALVDDGLDDLFTQLGENDAALRTLNANVERLAGALDGRVSVLEGQYGDLSGDVRTLHGDLFNVVRKGEELWKGHERRLRQQERENHALKEALGEQAVDLEGRFTDQLEMLGEDFVEKIRRVQEASTRALAEQQVAHSKDMQGLTEQNESLEKRISELERLLIEVWQIQPRKEALTATLTELVGKLEGDAWGEDSLEGLEATLSEGRNAVCDAVEEPDLGKAREDLEGVVEQLKGLKSAYETRIEGLRAQWKKRLAERVGEEYLGKRFGKLIAGLKVKINQVNGCIEGVQEEINFIDDSEQASLEFNKERKRLSVGYDGCQARFEECKEIKKGYADTLNGIQSECGNLKRDVGRIGTLDAMKEAEIDVEELVRQQASLVSIKEGFTTQQEGLNEDVTSFKGQSEKYKKARDRYLNHVGKLEKGKFFNVFNRSLHYLQTSFIEDVIIDFSIAYPALSGALEEEDGLSKTVDKVKEGLLEKSVEVDGFVLDEELPAGVGDNPTIGEVLEAFKKELFGDFSGSPSEIEGGLDGLDVSGIEQCDEKEEASLGDGLEVSLDGGLEASFWDEFEDVSFSAVRKGYREKLVSPVIDKYKERLKVFKDFRESPHGVVEGEDLSEKLVILKEISDEDITLEELARQDYVETLLGFEKVKDNSARMEEYLEGILLRTAGGKKTLNFSLLSADKKTKLETDLNALLPNVDGVPPKHSLEFCCASFKELFDGKEGALELITDAFAKAEYNVDAEGVHPLLVKRGEVIKGFVRQFLTGNVAKEEKLEVKSFPAPGAVGRLVVSSEYTALDDFGAFIDGEGCLYSGMDGLSGFALEGEFNPTDCLDKLKQARVALEAKQVPPQFVSYLEGVIQERIRRVISSEGEVLGEDVMGLLLEINTSQPPRNEEDKQLRAFTLLRCMDAQSRGVANPLIGYLLKESTVEGAKSLHDEKYADVHYSEPLSLDGVDPDLLKMLLGNMFGKVLEEGRLTLNEPENATGYFTIKLGEENVCLVNSVGKLFPAPSVKGMGFESEGPVTAQEQIRFVRKVLLDGGDFANRMMQVNDFAVGGEHYGLDSSLKELVGCTESLDTQLEATLKWLLKYQDKGFLDQAEFREVIEHLICQDSVIPAAEEVKQSEELGKDISGLQTQANDVFSKEKPNSLELTRATFIARMLRKIDSATSITLHAEFTPPNQHIRLLSTQFSFRAQELAYFLDQPDKGAQAVSHMIELGRLYEDYDSRDVEVREKREAQALYQKAVEKLGHPDCINGILGERLEGIIEDLDGTSAKFALLRRFFEVEGKAPELDVMNGEWQYKGDGSYELTVEDTNYRFNPITAQYFIDGESVDSLTAPCKNTEEFREVSPHAVVEKVPENETLWRSVNLRFLFDYKAADGEGQVDHTDCYLIADEGGEKRCLKHIPKGTEELVLPREVVYLMEKKGLTLWQGEASRVFLADSNGVLHYEVSNGEIKSPVGFKGCAPQDPSFQSYSLLSDTGDDSLAHSLGAFFVDTTEGDKPFFSMFETRKDTTQVVSQVLSLHSREGSVELAFKGGNLCLGDKKQCALPSSLTGAQGVLCFEDDGGDRSFLLATERGGLLRVDRSSEGVYSAEDNEGIVCLANKFATEQKWTEMRAVLEGMCCKGLNKGAVEEFEKLLRDAGGAVSVVGVEEKAPKSGKVVVPDEQAVYKAFVAGTYARHQLTYASEARIDNTLIRDAIGINIEVALLGQRDKEVWRDLIGSGRSYVGDTVEARAVFSPFIEDLTIDITSVKESRSKEFSTDSVAKRVGQEGVSVGAIATPDACGSVKLRAENERNKWFHEADTAHKQIEDLAREISASGSVLTPDELLVLCLQNSPAVQELGDEVRQKLENLTLRYLYAQTEVQHINNILKELDILVDMLRDSSGEGDVLLAQQKELLVNALGIERGYDVAEVMVDHVKDKPRLDTLALLFCEYNQGFRIRNEQKEFLQSILGGEKAKLVAQLPTGYGKTDVVMATLLLRKADGNTLCKLSAPDALAGMNMQDLNTKWQHLFHNKARFMTFDSRRAKDPGYLAELKRELVSLKANGNVLVTTHNGFDRPFYTAMHSQLYEGTSEETLSVLKEIEVLFKGDVFEIIDEADKVCTHRLDYNYTTPKRTVMHASKQDACYIGYKYHKAKTPEDINALILEHFNGKLSLENFEQFVEGRESVSPPPSSSVELTEVMVEDPGSEEEGVENSLEGEIEGLSVEEKALLVLLKEVLTKEIGDALAETNKIGDVHDLRIPPAGTSLVELKKMHGLYLSVPCEEGKASLNRDYTNSFRIALNSYAAHEKFARESVGFSGEQIAAYREDIGYAFALFQQLAKEVSSGKIPPGVLEGEYPLKGLYEHAIEVKEGLASSTEEDLFSALMDSFKIEGVKELLWGIRTDVDGAREALKGLIIPKQLTIADEIYNADRNFHLAPQEPGKCLMISATYETETFSPDMISAEMLEDRDEERRFQDRIERAQDEFREVVSLTAGERESTDKQKAEAYLRKALESAVGDSRDQMLIDAEGALIGLSNRKAAEIAYDTLVESRGVNLKIVYFDPSVGVDCLQVLYKKEGSEDWKKEKYTDFVANNKGKINAGEFYHILDKPRTTGTNVKATQRIDAVGTVITGPSVSTSDFKQAIGRFRTPLTQNFRLAATEGYLERIEGDKYLNAVVEEIKTRTQQQGSQEAYESMIKDLNSMIVQAAAEVLKNPPRGLTHTQRDLARSFLKQGGQESLSHEALIAQFSATRLSVKPDDIVEFLDKLKEVYQQKLESFAPGDYLETFTEPINNFIDAKKGKITKQIEVSSSLTSNQGDAVSEADAEASSQSTSQSEASSQSVSTSKAVSVDEGHPGALDGLQTTSPLFVKPKSIPLETVKDLSENGSAALERITQSLQDSPDVHNDVHNKAWNGLLGLDSVRVSDYFLTRGLPVGRELKETMWGQGHSYFHSSQAQVVEWNDGFYVLTMEEKEALLRKVSEGDIRYYDLESIVSQLRTPPTDGELTPEKQRTLFGIGMFLGGKSKELLDTSIGQTIKAGWVAGAEAATGGLSTSEVTFSGVFTGMNPQEVRVDRTLEAGVGVVTVHTKKAVSSGGNIYDELDIDSGLRPPLAVNKPWDENVSDGSERLEPRVFIKGGATFTLRKNGDYTYNGEPDSIPIQLGGQVLSLPVNMEGSDLETEDIIQDDGDFISDRDRALAGDVYENEKAVLKTVYALEKDIRTEYDDLQSGEGKRLSRITVITELLGGVSDEDLNDAYTEVEEGVRGEVSRGLEEQIRGLGEELGALKTQESTLSADLTVKKEEKRGAEARLETARVELAKKDTAVDDARQALGFHYTPPEDFERKVLSSIVGKKTNLRPATSVRRLVSLRSSSENSIQPEDAEKARKGLVEVLEGLVGQNDLMLEKARDEQERLSSMGIDEVLERIGLLRDLSDEESAVYKTKEILKDAIDGAKSVMDLMKNLMPKNKKVFPRGVPDGKDFKKLLLAALFDGGAEVDHTFRNFSDFIVKVSDLNPTHRSQFDADIYNNSRDELNVIVKLVHFLGLPNKAALRRFLSQSTNPDSNLREAKKLMKTKFNINCRECSDFDALIEIVRSCDIVKLREDTGLRLAEVIRRLEIENAYVNEYLQLIRSTKRNSKIISSKQHITKDKRNYEAIRDAFPDDQEIQELVDQVIGPRTDDFMDTFWDEFENVDEVTDEKIAGISTRDSVLATKLSFLKNNNAENLVNHIIRGRLEEASRDEYISLLGEMKRVGVLEDGQYEQLKALVNLRTGQSPGSNLPDPVKTAYREFESFKASLDMPSSKPECITQDSWMALTTATGERDDARGRVEGITREVGDLETALADKTAEIDGLNLVIQEKTRQRSAVDASQSALGEGWSAIFKGCFERESDLNSVVDAIFGDYGVEVSKALFTDPLKTLKEDPPTAVQSFNFLGSAPEGQERRDALGLGVGVADGIEWAKLNAELEGLQRLQVLQETLAERAAKSLLPEELGEDPHGYDFNTLIDKFFNTGFIEALKVDLKGESPSFFADSVYTEAQKIELTVHQEGADLDFSPSMQRQLKERHEDLKRNLETRLQAYRAHLLHVDEGALEQHQEMLERIQEEIKTGGVSQVSPVSVTAAQLTGPIDPPKPDLHWNDKTLSDSTGFVGLNLFLESAKGEVTVSSGSQITTNVIGDLRRLDGVRSVNAASLLRPDGIFSSLRIDPEEVA